MSKSRTAGDESLYALRVASRMTGLKPELIRAWEARYEAVRPRRTAGGSRRYSAADLDRLRLLREVVESGHRIGGVARLSIAELQALRPVTGTENGDCVARAIAAAERLDTVELQRLLRDEMSVLGTVDFALEVALPLLYAVGRRWEGGHLNVSVEHIVTGIVRSLLLSAIGAPSERPAGARLLFATPSGEPHDVGTLVAALVATRAGVDVMFLGADVPTTDLVETAVESNAVALVLGIVTLPKPAAEGAVRDLRARLPAKLGLWIGGAGIRGLPPIEGVARIENFAQFEAHATRVEISGRAVG